MVIEQLEKVLKLKKGLELSPSAPNHTKDFRKIVPLVISVN